MYDYPFKLIMFWTVYACPEIFSWIVFSPLAYNRDMLTKDVAFKNKKNSAFSFQRNLIKTHVKKEARPNADRGTCEINYESFCTCPYFRRENVSKKKVSKYKSLNHQETSFIWLQYWAGPRNRPLPNSDAVQKEIKKAVICLRKITFTDIMNTD